ncbi:MAG: primosomal protein DnaI [Streptococcaceae bacterium]|jgi:primosomal protein DnaI|nr:primosomal protein DnaI [Streptococcaceae bacterium]
MIEYIGSSRGLNPLFNKTIEEKKLAKIHKGILSDKEIKAFLKKHKDELTEKEVNRSFTKLYEYVSQKDKFLTQDKTYVAPGYEPKLIFHNHSIDVAYEPTEVLLAEQREEEIKARIHAMNMPKDVRNASFKTITLTRDSHRVLAIKKAKNFVKSFIADPFTPHKGLYLYGNFGIGKSFLMGAIANELAIKGFVTTLLHFPSFLAELRDAMNFEKKEIGSKIKAVKVCEILILDDIGAESVTSWSRDDILLGILQYRMQEQLPTMFTSNRDFKGLEEHLRFDNKGNDELMQGRRVMERIKYLSEEVLYGGDNARNPV